jgi:hypothetical protein
MPTTDLDKRGYSWTQLTAGERHEQASKTIPDAAGQPESCYGSEGWRSSSSERASVAIGQGGAVSARSRPWAAFRVRTAAREATALVLDRRRRPPQRSGGPMLPPQCVTCPAPAITVGAAGEGAKLGDLLPHLNSVIVDNIECTPSAVVFRARYWPAEAASPACGTWSSRVHGSDRLKTLARKRSHDVEPGVHDEQRRCRGRGGREIPGAAEREVTRAGQGGQEHDVEARPCDVVIGGPWREGSEYAR